MRNCAITILFLSLFSIQFGCNTEEGLTPVTPPSYIKIIEGTGADDPIAIRALSDGNLLIVTNSVSFEQGEQRREIRVLKLNLDGKNVMEPKYFPEGEENNKSWSAKDVLITESNEILIASTIQNSFGEDSSLLFFKIDESLEFINSTSYQQDEASYNLLGIEKSNNEFIFTAEERESNGSDSYPIIGRLNSSNLEVVDVRQAVKYDVPPATKAFRDEAGKYVWAYNRTRSYLAKVQPDLLQVNDQEIFLAGQGAPRAKKLLMKENNPIVFGEVENGEQNQLFYYNQNAGSSFVFGVAGNTLLNNVQLTEDGYLVTGYQDLQIEGTESRERNFFLSRRNENGGEIFSKTFGSRENEELSDAVMIHDGIYSIGKTVFGGENTLVLIKTDAFGQLKN